MDLFIGSHSGYRRLRQPVTPVRHVVLDKTGGWVAIADRLEGKGEHEVRIPYRFAPGVAVSPKGQNLWELTSGDVRFLLVVQADGWEAGIFDCEISHSYGRKSPAKGLAFTHAGPLAALTVAFVPAASAPADPNRWLAETIGRVF